jgi:Sigma-70 region 2
VKETNLDMIETNWDLIHEPYYVVNRYAPAIHGYLFALLKNTHDAEDVAQELLLWLSQYGLPRVRQERGRFRDYLKRVLHNKARNFLRHCACSPSKQRSDFKDVAAPPESPDQTWLVQWRDCLLKRAWDDLKIHEGHTPNNLFYTVLQLITQYPGEDSTQLAHRASLNGKLIRGDAFRKQVSRGRRLFAQLLVNEIALTLDHPDAAQVEEELVDLDLMRYVRKFLPVRKKLSVT